MRKKSAGKKLSISRRYVFLNHTADAKFQAFGRTLEEAFTNAALATASLMWDADEIGRKIQHTISIRGKDLERLLLSFLEEIIYLLDTQNFLLGAASDVQIEKRDKDYRLTAVFLGDECSSKYNIYGEVKAITYNEMIIKENDHVTLQVVVDM